MKTGDALVLVAALDEERGIGLASGLPWSLPEDMRHFRAVTMGHALIVGGTTQRSIGKALPGRRTIVLSRAPEASFPGCEVVASPEEALTRAREHDAAPRVIGGAQIYALFLPRATELLLTRVPGRHAADAHFPDVAPESFRLVESRSGETPGLVFERWLRS